ncbi:SLOW WALKER 1 protein [Spatholobus suberectus]|nr:SLOW WALKER 1 protein [Spatholobus suberectus]
MEESRIEKSFPVKPKLRSKPRTPKQTPESKYWSSFKTQQIPSLISVPSLTFSPTPPHSFAAAHSASLTLFSSQTLSPTATISSFSDAVSCASFRSDALLLAASDLSGLVQVFDAKSRSPLAASAPTPAPSASSTSPASTSSTSSPPATTPSSSSGTSPGRLRCPNSSATRTTSGAAIPPLLIPTFSLPVPMTTWSGSGTLGLGIRDRRRRSTTARPWRMLLSCRRAGWLRRRVGIRLSCGT